MCSIGNERFPKQAGCCPDLSDSHIPGMSAPRQDRLFAQDLAHFYALCADYSLAISELAYLLVCVCLQVDCCKQLDAFWFLCLI